MDPNILANSVYFVDGLRTPVAIPFKGLKDYDAGRLAGLVIENITSRNKIKKTSVDEVVMGNVVQAGTGQNLARQAVFHAGFPKDTPGYVVNNVCGSGLQSVISAVQAILTSDRNLVIAGGSESATHAPVLVPQTGTLEDFRAQEQSLAFDGLFCRITQKKMGELAETVASKHRISRREQDDFALESHRKAVYAQSSGLFKRETLSVASGQKKLEKDERPRAKLSEENFKILPPAFKKRGTITAGNSSAPSDGAAGVLVASQVAVDKFRLKPRARLLGYCTLAFDPKKTFEGTVMAVEECLKRSRLDIADIDVFEIAESFAAQALLTIKKCSIPPAKVNIFGGDIALGHPLGAAGTRALVTLMNVLEGKGLKRGMAAICFGGGGAVAICIERID